MKEFKLAVVIGLILAIPLIIYLNLKNFGGMALLIILCGVVVYILIALSKIFKKPKEQKNGIQNNEH